MANTQPSVDCKFVDLPNWVKLYIERWHTGVSVPSQTIVCIHCMGSTSSIFFPFIKPLLDLIPTAHVLLYDWAGLGLSPLPKTSADRTVADFVGDFDAIVVAVAPSGRISLVPHSAGTIIASRWLLTASPAVSRVTHVAYLGGPINPPLPSQVTAMQQDMAATIAACGPSAIVDNLVPVLLGKTSVAERPLAVGMLRAITLGQSPEGYAAAIRALSEDLAGEKINWVTVQTKAKVLVVYGEEDGMISGSDVAGFLKKASVVKVPHAGHTLTLESPEIIAKLVADFLGDQ